MSENEAEIIVMAQQVGQAATAYMACALGGDMGADGLRSPEDAGKLWACFWDAAMDALGGDGETEQDRGTWHQPEKHTEGCHPVAGEGLPELPSGVWAPEPPGVVCSDPDCLASCPQCMDQGSRLNHVYHSPLGPVVVHHDWPWCESCGLPMPDALEEAPPLERCPMLGCQARLTYPHAHWYHADGEWMKRAKPLISPEGRVPEGMGEEEYIRHYRVAGATIGPDGHPNRFDWTGRP